MKLTSRYLEDQMATKISLYLEDRDLVELPAGPELKRLMNLELSDDVLPISVQLMRMAHVAEMIEKNKKRAATASVGSEKIILGDPILFEAEQ